MGTKTKSDNRRALPKYILTIVIAAFSVPRRASAPAS